MAERLLFDPTSEFEILETIENFEEEIQRPEDIRFFTLEEQLLDYFEKVIPKRKATRQELQMLKYDRDRMRLAYGNYIHITETDYVVDVNRKQVKVDWITPVYSSFDYKTYSYAKEYVPLFERDSRRTPNYYPRLLSALPRPYSTTGEGILLSSNETLTNEKGENSIKALANYQRTRTVIHDDGTMDVVATVVPNTGDDIKISGYYLKARELDLPNPMADHPFLRSTQPGYVKSEFPLLNIYPSFATILEHAIPVTTDPYTEGKQYLKLYDVKLSQIPWSSWKQRFPPVETKQSITAVTSINFPSDNKEQEPGEVLTKQYHTSWYPGLHPRLWLSKQIDAGHLVSQLLLSEASESGVLPTPPPMDAPSPSYPSASADICMNLTGDFDTFLSSGLFRVIKNTGVCVPVGMIHQEKSNDVFKGKLGWREDTKSIIQATYLKVLNAFQISDLPDSVVKYEKVDRLPESERRNDVLVILKDYSRSPEDRADAIELITRDLHMVEKQYIDVGGKFVICAHTLEVLHGKLEDDRMGFYSEWTYSQDGGRICKFCHEEINKDSFVATKEYDDDGHLMMDYQALEKTTYNGNSQIDVFTNSLVTLKRLFDLENAGESILYILLSILQILPQETQVLPLLQLIRRLTSSLKSRASSGKISKENQDRIEGILGIASAVVLLQTHNPFLIPKRSLGSKPMNLSGFPRDSTNPKESPVLDSVILVLRKTLEAFPATYRGSVAAISRQVLSKPEKVKEEIVPYLKVFFEQFKPLFEHAIDRYSAPVEEAPLNLIQFPIIRIDNPLFKINDEVDAEQNTSCSVFRTLVSWTTKKLPTIVQNLIRLRRPIYPSPRNKILNVNLDKIQTVNISDKEIRSGIASGLPSGFPLLSEIMKRELDSSVICTLTSRLLDLVSKTGFSKSLQSEFRSNITLLDVTQSPSLLRDTAKSIFFNFLHAIKKDRNTASLTRLINESLKTDLTLRMILLSKNAADKEEFELRSNETNLLKKRYREMNDTQREITKMLVDIGISDFIVTNEDREVFARQFEVNIEREYAQLQEELDTNRPEEGYDNIRDYVENGDQPVAYDGSVMNVDRGDYGDRAVRDYNDYTEQTMFEDNDGDGI